MYKKIGLQTKLFSTLSFLAVLVLLSSSYLIVTDFERDKIQQVYEMGLQKNKIASDLLQSEIRNQRNNFNKIFRNIIGKKLNKQGRKNFFLDQSMTHIWSYQLQKNGKYGISIAMTKTQNTVIPREEIVTLSNLAMARSLAFKILPEESGWILALRFNSQKGPLVLTSRLISGEFINEFAEQNLYKSFLLNEDNKIVAGPKALLNRHPYILKSIHEKLIQQNLQQSSFEITGIESWIVSVAEMDLENYRLVTLVKRSAATGPIQFARLKLAIICLFFIFTTFILSQFLSHKLTINLNHLMMATNGIKSGNFNAKVNIQSSDEFGELAKNFNDMTDEIQRLMLETAEKARMEGELKTAQMVQSNLFPELEYEDQDIKISGFYEPASECGGDWWFHSHIGSKTYLWIGDATGHGASAALVTSAAKSAANVAQTYEGIKINEILALMNNAIYDTTEGNVNMTFFLACYDHDTKEFSYTRASHNPAYLMKASRRPVKRDNIVVLMEGRGRRLGEQPGSEYTIEKVSLDPGDCILFYTDGITELLNKEHKMYGERKVIRLIAEGFNEKQTVSKINSNLCRALEDYREGEPLHDDMTYFLFERKESA